MEEEYVKPEFTREDAEKILLEHYEIKLIDSQKLYSFDDQNLKIKTDDNKTYILKILSTYKKKGRKKKKFKKKKLKLEKLK